MTEQCSEYDTKLHPVEGSIFGALGSVENSFAAIIPKSTLRRIDSTCQCWISGSNISEEDELESVFDWFQRISLIVRHFRSQIEDFMCGFLL